MISVWSVFSSSLWFALVSLLIYALHRREDLLMRYGVAAWSFTVLLSLVRLLTPVDNEHMVILRSYTVLPALNRVLNYELLKGITVRWLLLILWLTGTLLGLLFILYGLLRDRYRLRQLPTLPLSPEMRATVRTCGLNGVAVYITPAVATPMAVGLVEPVICLPVLEYSETELYWILRHELTHISRHDAWLRLAFLLFRCLFWWNPFVHWSQRSVDDILELCCDKAVLEGTDAPGRTEYVESLYGVANRLCRGGSSFVGAGTFAKAGKKDILLLRANQAAEAPRPSRGSVVSMIVLSIVLFVTSYAFILQPISFPSDMEDGVEIYQSSSEISYLKALPSGKYERWCDGELVEYITADMRNDEAYKDLEVLP